jgi:hypothetical protein
MSRSFTIATKSKPLREVLESRFFPYAESLGFIRDDRQQPRIICFRRKTETAVQVFAVTWEKAGRPRFFVEFGEAPLAGIDYAGHHLLAEDIWPGNFALDRGRILPERRSMWFRMDHSFWYRMTSNRRVKADEIVNSLLQLFREVTVWWENKIQGPHLLLIPRNPLFEKPDFKTMPDCLVIPTALQRFFAMEEVLAAAFFAVAVSVALFIAVQASPDWQQMILLVLAGSAGGALIAWISLKVLWSIRIRINGGPFRKGDLVQVIRGPHAGKVGLVYEEWPSRHQVRVALDKSAWSEGSDAFSYVQLCKVENSRDKKQGQPIPMTDNNYNNKSNNNKTPDA